MSQPRTIFADRIANLEDLEIAITKARMIRAAHPTEILIEGFFTLTETKLSDGSVVYDAHIQEDGVR